MGVPVAQERGTSSSRYTILGRLASGGMADIYLVLASTAAGVDRYLVLKRVLAERSRDPVFAQMFLDEARLAAQLQHPNIAQVHDVGKLEGAYFFTMEYVHGEDVRHILQKLSKRQKLLPENLALYIASGALAALHYAHERTTPDGKPLDIVHRDVSPSNVMVSLDGNVKLLDFGVAKASERATESRSGSIKGKLAYLSPEQVKAAKLDRRSDVYAMGIVLWEMLTCRRLYKQESDFEAMMAITSEPTPAPSTIRPDLSPEIDRIVLTALEKDPDKRYASAAAMLEDIEALATTERHLLSSSAMGRFMKETFPTKVEPWVNLEIPERPIGPVTITSEEIVSADPIGALTRQLELAPDLQPSVGFSTPPSGVGAIKEPSALPTAPPKRSPWIAILVTVAVVVGAGVVGARLYMGKDTPAQPPVDKPTIMAVGSETSSNAKAEPTTTTTPTTPIPAVPSPEPPVARATIASAFAAQDWAATVGLCAVEAKPPDLSSCGVAACQMKRDDQALLYHRRAPRAGQLAIERACTAAGITLVKKAAAPVRPRRPNDPCKNPAYVEANPLQCQ